MNITEHALTVVAVLVGTGAMFVVTLVPWALDAWHKRHLRTRSASQYGPRVHVRGREVRR